MENLVLNLILGKALFYESLCCIRVLSYYVALVALDLSCGFLCALHYTKATTLGAITPSNEGKKIFCIDLFFVVIFCMETLLENKKVLILLLVVY